MPSSSESAPRSPLRVNASASTTASCRISPTVISVDARVRARSASMSRELDELRRARVEYRKSPMITRDLVTEERVQRRHAAAKH